MKLMQLAWSNFRRSIREYAALILSLTFSVFIFYNFQNVAHSDSLNVLREMKKEHIDVIVNALSVVFGVFLFFFIWYATNVFLAQRKKEIGIYTFMGLDNVRIGKLYAMESSLVGIFSIGFGVLLGMAFSKLFLMLLLRISEIPADIRFSVSVTPAAITCAVFGIVYAFMILKGYFSIVRSSVLNLLSGAKQKEMKPEKRVITLLKVLLGLGVLSAGYWCALETGEISSLNYAVAAVALVICGTYLLYSGVIPFVVRVLTEKKKFLYQKQRTLWLNNLSYRIKRNYRAYAMVTILMIGSVTVLATSFAMKNRYDEGVHFRETYTYQVFNTKERLNEKELKEGISKENEVAYQNQVRLVLLDEKDIDTRFAYSAYGMVPYSEVKHAAKTAGLEFPYGELKDNETVRLSHVMLLSIVSKEETENIRIGKDEFQVLAEDDSPYMGELQNSVDMYVVNDARYEKLKELGQEGYIYNCKIKAPDNADASRKFLVDFVIERDPKYGGVSIVTPEAKDKAWIKIMYSLCIFMFATLILASGCIIFMKLNNDAYEDRERYRVLQKIGMTRETLAKSIRNEIRFTYYCPFILMAVTSYFSVKALGNVMKEELFQVNIYSAAVILAIFTVIYIISVKIFEKRVLE